MKIVCSPRTDRFGQPNPTVSQVGNRYTLSFPLPPQKLDKLKVYLEHDRVVVQAEFLRKFETPEGPATLRVPYERDFLLPSHVGREAFFPLLEEDTLRLTLFVKERLATPAQVAPTLKEAVHSY